MFTDIDNPFGTDSFAPPATHKVKPAPRLPRVKRGTHVLRAPKPPSQIIKNILLTW